MADALPDSDGAPHFRGGTVVLTSTPSDSHTWGLVLLQLMLEEAGYHVRNLGACAPVAAVLRECRAARPDLVVVSSVNGHGRVDGAELISAFRGSPDLLGLPVVIGGMLTTGGADPAGVESELRDLGYAEVFVRDSALPDFFSYLHAALSPAHANVH